MHQRIFYYSEQAACFIPIKIESGHCLAGYVAWSKETVRINNMIQVSLNNSHIYFIWILVCFVQQIDTTKYPDGLYVKDDKVTAVMAHPIINASGTLLGMRKQ